MRHALKLVWRRRATNLLLVAEIAISFLVVFAVCLGAIHVAWNARHPLGFDRERLWAVEITEGGDDAARSAGEDAAAAREDPSRVLLREALALPQVESAGLVQNAPYEMSESSTQLDVEGRMLESETVFASDELAGVLKLDVVEGRWFEPADEARHWRPAVVNRRLAREAFGDADPIGGVLSGDDAPTELRVVGVVSEFRRKGELSRPGNFTFLRQPAGASASLPLRNLVLRLLPGVRRDFERELVSRLEDAAPGMSVRVRTVEELRDLNHRFALVPLVIGTVVAAFLILMTVLGLLGVLWQDVVRRRAEIGLRRALGADAAAVHRQVLGELLVLVGLSLVLGLLVVAHLPVLGVVGAVGRGVFATAIVAAAVLTVLLTSAAAFYPSHLATRIQPARALHHD